jgi:hypothetical protein
MGDTKEERTAPSQGDTGPEHPDSALAAEMRFLTGLLDDTIRRLAGG